MGGGLVGCTVSGTTTPVSSSGMDSACLLVLLLKLWEPIENLGSSACLLVWLLKLPEPINNLGSAWFAGGVPATSTSLSRCVPELIVILLLLVVVVLLLLLVILILLLLLLVVAVRAETDAPGAEREDKLAALCLVGGLLVLLLFVEEIFLQAEGEDKLFILFAGALSLLSDVV